MKVYVISLARAAERRDRITRRLEELSVPYELFEAVDGAALDKRAKRATIDGLRFWCAMGRGAFDGEIGCALSHRGLWQKAFAGNRAEPVCVLEDDAELFDGFPNALREIETRIDALKPLVVLLSDHDGQLVFAEGYVITAPAAKAIDVANTPLTRPFDHWWKWRDMGLAEVVHYNPPVVSQNIHQTTIGRAKAYFQMNLFEKIWWKAKRAIGRLILAMIPERSGRRSV